MDSSVGVKSSKSTRYISSGKDSSYAIPTTQAGGNGSVENVVLIEDEDEDEEKETDSMDEMENPYIELTIRKSYIYTMRLPKEFASRIELGSAKKNIVLRNKEMKEWNVVMTRYKNGINLTSHWFDFCKENMITEWDKCSFRYFNGNGVSHDMVMELAMISSKLKFFKREEILIYSNI